MGSMLVRNPMGWDLWELRKDELRRPMFASVQFSPLGRR